MEVGLIIVALAIIAFVLVMKSDGQTKAAVAEMRKSATQALGATPPFFWMEASRKSGIACDAELTRLYWMTNSGDTIRGRTIPADKVLSVELIEDGETIVKTSRGGQLGGMAVGGVLLGGVGAVVGGLSASQRHKTEVSNVRLRIIVDDATRPELILTFLNFAADRSGGLYRQFRQFADDWHARIKVMIERAQRAGERLPVLEPVVDRADTLARLERLAALRAAGHLTDDEFAAQKLALLAAPPDGSKHLAP